MFKRFYFLTNLDRRIKLIPFDKGREWIDKYQSLIKNKFDDWSKST